MDSDTHFGGGLLATLGLSFGSFDGEDCWWVDRVEAFVFNADFWPPASLLIENGDVSVLRTTDRKSLLSSRWASAVMI